MEIRDNRLNILAKKIIITKINILAVLKNRNI
jgi:hypothetical protein